MLTRTPRLAATLALGLSLAAGASRADVVTLTLDDPNQTVTVPASGSITLDFTGTLSIASGYTYNGASLDYAFDAGNVHSVLTFFPNPIPYGAANNGNTFTGLLFTATVDSTTLPGLYFTNPGEALSSLKITAENSDHTPSSGTAAFSIQVNSVPEPSTMALTAVGTGLVAAGLGRGRRRVRS